jgi:uroporphyrinogen decarboxylase
VRRFLRKRFPLVKTSLLARCDGSAKTHVVKDRLLKAARREPTDTTPIWIMRQAGRYLPEYRAIRQQTPFLTLCKTPELAAEVTVQPITRLGVDGAVIFSDILIPIEAMGMELELGDKGPHLPSPIRTAADVQALRIPDPVEATGFLADAISLTKKSISVPVIGFCGAPFTLAAYMIEGGGSKNFLNVKRFLFEQPKLAHQLFETLTQTLIPYLKMQVEAGAGMVQIFDSWGGELSLQDFETFSLPYLTRMVEAVHSVKTPVVLFGTSMSTHLELMKRTGADVIGLDWRIDIRTARERLTADVAVQGNLDPTALFLPREELRSRAEAIIRGAGPLGHIFNLGHGILPPTDPEAARFLVEQVHELGAELRARSE